MKCIYVFLYQNLNLLDVNLQDTTQKIYVFLYQNLNLEVFQEENPVENNLCISILEFKFKV